MRAVNAGPAAPAAIPVSMWAPSNPPTANDYVVVYPGNTAANPYNYQGDWGSAQLPGQVTWMGAFTPDGVWHDFGAGAQASIIDGFREFSSGVTQVVGGQAVKCGVTIGALYVQPPASSPALPTQQAPVAAPSSISVASSASLASQAAPAPTLVTATAPANTAATNATAPQPAIEVIAPAPVVATGDTDASQAATQVAPSDDSGLLWLLLAAGVLFVLA